MISFAVHQSLRVRDGEGLHAEVDDDRVRSEYGRDESATDRLEWDLCAKDCPSEPAFSAASVRTGECDFDLVRAKPGKLSEILLRLTRCFKPFDVFSCSASTTAFSVSILLVPLGDERTDERFSVGSFLASRRLLTLCTMSNWLKHKGIARPGRSLYYR